MAVKQALGSLTVVLLSRLGAFSGTASVWNRLVYRDRSPNLTAWRGQLRRSSLEFFRSHLRAQPIGDPKPWRSAGMVGWRWVASGAQDQLAIFYRASRSSAGYLWPSSWNIQQHKFSDFRAARSNAV